MHQEDLCQALGRRPDDKYQSEGGPTPAEIVDVIADHSVAPRRDLQGFLDALIYNWVVAAPDGHAKNYSFLLDEQSVALAPLYDLISYLPYRRGTVVDKLTIAMRVGRDYTLRKHDRPSAWKTAAALIRVDPTTAIEQAADILARCPEAVDAAIDNLDAQDRASPYTAAMSGEVLQRRNSALGGLRAPRRRQGSKPGSGAGSDTPAAAGPPAPRCGADRRPVGHQHLVPPAHAADRSAALWGPKTWSCALTRHDALASWEAACRTPSDSDTGSDTLG